MGKRKQFFRIEQLSLAQQIGRMAPKHPQMEIGLKRNAAIWTGPWLPSLLSDTYQLRITYMLRQRPRVDIVTPHLKLATGKTKLPHVYRGGQHDICVHRPEEWNRSLYVADMLMPWISQWLRFYEIWAQTGSWEGGGTHPEAKSHQSQPEQDSGGDGGEFSERTQLQR